MALLTPFSSRFKVAAAMANLRDAGKQRGIQHGLLGGMPKKDIFTGKTGN